MKNAFYSDRDSTCSLKERSAVRSLAIFAVLVSLPLAPQYWHQLFGQHVAIFQVLFDLVNYVPNILPTPQWGLASFSSLFAIAFFALAGGTVWANLDRRGENDSDLYNAARLLLQYKLAFALLSYGIVKFFPLQFPHITLSDLNTNYGDFLPWKIYYLTNSAAAAGYQRTLGAFEVVSGILLLWRRFSSIGAVVAAGALVDIVLVNFAYQIGDHVYATLLLLIAVIILTNDAHRLFDLLILRRAARADHFHSRLSDYSQRKFSVAVHAFVIAFFVIYAVATYASYRNRDWPSSGVAGLASSEGLYDVKEFSVNDNIIPYSIVDPVRWQNVVFERWNTLSIRSNRPLVLQVARPNLGSNNIRDYEVAGNGGRHFFSYTFDGHTLHLSGRNDPGAAMTLTYQRNADGQIVLDGRDEHGNMLHAVLEKINKTYLLNEGRRKPLTIY